MQKILVSRCLLGHRVRYDGAQMEMLEKRNEQLSNYLQKEDKSQSAGNLIKLYEQGFHICHSSYGSIREEDCIFCLNVIDRTE